MVFPIVQCLKLCVFFLRRMLQHWCSFRTVPAQGGEGHQLQYKGFHLQKLLQEETYSWGDCFGSVQLQKLLREEGEMPLVEAWGAAGGCHQLQSAGAQLQKLL